MIRTTLRGKEQCLATAPLRPYILRAAKLLDGEPREFARSWKGLTAASRSGISELARRYAFAYGVKHGTADRLLHRVLHEKDYVALNIADRICCLLGTHIEIVYAEKGGAHGKATRTAASL